MQVLTVKQSPALSGTVSLQGAKNSALKLMAASLLTTGTTQLDNVPSITDVTIMADVLRAIGAGVSRRHDGVVEIDAPESATPIAPYELVEKMRASIVVLGPLLARHHFARISLPGGDDFGPRPIDMHLRALGELGAEFTTQHGYVEGRSDRLVGARVVLEYPSHTTTDNLLCAAVLAKGTTLIENAAREPEIQDLADFLTQMGARIAGAGTSRIEIEGVDELSPVRHRVISDRVEAATFLAAVAIVHGSVFVSGARAEHMDMYLSKLHEMGVEIDATPTGVGASAEDRPRSVDVVTLPYPGVATDYKPLLVTALSIGTGVAIVSENIYAGRFRYVDELRRMGANITTEGHHAVVRGVEKLSGTTVRAPDIRAGAALVLAGLAAEGESVITGVEHIDRGYEKLDEKLRSLGAPIERHNLDGA
ncbi:MAG: UDP-N-acetylglucosamine 1-carboxyvinyltransferase [Acidimicrobiales bacterium]